MSVKPGFQTSEFYAAMLALINTVAMPILASHGVASGSVSNVESIGFDLVVAVYAIVRTWIKGQNGGTGSTTTTA